MNIYSRTSGNNILYISVKKELKIVLLLRRHGYTYVVFGKARTLTPSLLRTLFAGIDSVLMQGQEDIGVILLFNDNAHARNPLSLAHSPDKGKTWQRVAVVDYSNSTGTFQCTYA